MGKVRVNEYILTNPKIKKEKIILNMSDLHGNNEKLEDIIKVLKQIKVDYICIPGDIIDNLDQDGHEEFVNNLKQLTKYAKIYITLGNHDIKYNNYLSDEEISNLDNYTFYKNIKDIKDIKLFKNDFNTIDLDDNITINSINLPKEYYKNHDDINIFEEFMKNIKIYTDKNKFNILLIHSPNGLANKKEILINKITKDMDLILCGHNHAGLVPVFIQDIFNNHVGLVGPYATLCHNNSYGTWNTNNISLLVSNGVEKISPTSKFKPLHKFLRLFFLSEIDLIYLTNSNKNNISLKERKIYKI